MRMVSKVAQLSAIHTEIFHCTKCPLHIGRNRTVPGAGDPDAEILFIGEAPGFHEDQQGLPFVGKSGKYLEKLLATINLSRDEVFIANVVKCRPSENRDPVEDEITACHPYLAAQIETIDPLMIVTLGRYSMNLFFPNERVSQIHGQPKYGTRRVYYPLFHPAYALRNEAAQDDMLADIARIPQLLLEVRAKRAAAIATHDALETEAITPEPPEATATDAQTEAAPADTPDDDPPHTPQQMSLFD